MLPKKLVILSVPPIRPNARNKFNLLVLRDRSQQVQRIRIGAAWQHVRAKQHRKGIDTCRLGLFEIVFGGTGAGGRHRRIAGVEPFAFFSYWRPVLKIIKRCGIAYSNITVHVKSHHKRGWYTHRVLR